MEQKQIHILDELLVLETQKGDMKALTLLVKRWQPALLRQAYRLTGNSDAALDVVQESWQAIVKGIYHLKETRAFKTWVFRIVSNKSANWVHEWQKDRKLMSSHDLVETTNISDEHQGENLEKVKAALQVLPQNSKTLLSMFYVDSFSVKEIAGIMQVSEGTVKSRLFYARKKLKEVFDIIK